MNRRIWIAGAAAAALAAAIAILLIKFGGGPEDEAALELDDIESQTPVQTAPAPTAEETQETSDDSDAAAESQGKAETAGAGGKYDFKTWEEALDHYAELVGKQYDLMDKSVTIPRSEKYYDPEMHAMLEEAYVWARAGHDVHQRVYVEGEDPQLKEALESIEFPPYAFNPIDLLVRAGRLPESVLYQEIDLPNGEVYRLKRAKHLIVRYERRGYVTEERRQRIANLESEEKDLLRRMSMSSSEDEKYQLNEQLMNVQSNLDVLRQPSYGRHKFEYGEIYPGHPDSEVIELDLGRIETPEKPLTREEVEAFIIGPIPDE